MIARTKPSLGRFRSGSILEFVAGLVLALVVLAAVMPALLGTQDPLAQDAEVRLQPPSSEHFFGTDGLGRDVFSRVVYAARTSLYVGLLAVILSTALGTVIGLLSAYRGGRTDLILQRFVDLLLGFPPLVLALIILVAFKSSPTTVALAIAVTLTPQVARVARAGALSTMQQGYISAARSVGAGPIRIAVRHLLPNSFAPLLAQVSGHFGTAVVAEATLSFLGMGVPPPNPAWGRMLQEGASRYLEAAPWTTIFPGIFLSATVVSFALLGDALRRKLPSRQ